MYRYAKLSVLTVSLVAVIASAALAGPVGGTEWEDGCLDAKQTMEFESLIWGNRPLIVQLSGDGKSDLDLFVYDMQGNLLDADTVDGDDAYVQISRPQTPKVKIVVVNRGDARDCFDLVIE